MKGASEIDLEIDSLIFRAIGHSTLQLTDCQLRTMKIAERSLPKQTRVDTPSEREREYLWNTNFDFLLGSEKRWLGYETVRIAVSNMSQQVSEKLLL